MRDITTIQVNRHREMKFRGISRDAMLLSSDVASAVIVPDGVLVDLKCGEKFLLIAVNKTGSDHGNDSARNQSKDRRG